MVVNVISDITVYRNKKIFPGNNQQIRVSNLEKLKIADEIIAVSDDEDKNLDSIREILIPILLQ